MMLIDAGPLVAAFSRSDRAHEGCRKKFMQLRDPAVSILPVLTEVFHLLSPESAAANDVRAVVRRGTLKLHLPDAPEIDRAFALMEEYSDLPMDFADASLIAAAETLGTRRIFTLDARDFAVYRIRRGHRLLAVEIV